jgi:hypothetical protein
MEEGESVHILPKFWRPTCPSTDTTPYCTYCYMRNVITERVECLLTSSHEVPVLVHGGQLLGRARLHHIHPGGQLQVGVANGMDGGEG